MVVFCLVASILRKAREWFDETEIHRFDQACACSINDILLLGIVFRLGDHREDFQQLALHQLLGQLTVV